MHENPEKVTGDTPKDEEALSDKRLQVGTLIDGRYEVLAHIGSGGMGEVYKVLDRETQKLFALKMISPQLAEKKILAKRLEHEAHAARTLVHGNIVSVYDVGAATDGAPYLIMDYVEGEGLDLLLKAEACLSQKRALPIFMQIAEALVHAQQKSIVHRDLKPSNILMTKTPEGNDMVKIVDFGIAKISDQDGADKTKLTQTGELLGTPLYMSPEQCTGDEIDARSDIYSFGCIMHEVLSGKSPFAAENSVKVILKHLNDDAPPLPNNVGITADMKEVIARCLEKHRDNRYKTPVDLHIDLERISDGRPIRPHERKIKTKSKDTGKSRVPALVGLMAGLLVVAVGGTYAFFSLQPKPKASTAGSFQRAEKYLDKTLTQWSNEIEKNPDDPSLYLHRGELHAMRDERTNAIDDFTEALKLKPNFLQAYASRCFEYMILAQYDKALVDANRLIALAPDSAEGYAKRGMVYESSEMFGEAVADYQRAIALDPNNGYYYYGASMNLLRLAKYDQVEKYLKRAIELGDENGTYSANLGTCYTFQQKYDDAYKYLSFDPANPKVRGVEWGQASYYYVCVGKMDQAMDAMAQLKARETFPARSHRVAGEIFRCAGQLEKALQELSSSTSLEEYPPGYREKAVVAFTMGQTRSALTDLKKSISLNGKSSTTLTWLARVENKLGSKKEAEQHLAQAFSQKMVAPISYVNRAAVRLENGDAKAALADADTAVKQDRWLKEGYEVRSEIRKKLGDAAGAEKDAEEAKKLISHMDL
ncbi:MAG: hypothetical protein DKT66_14030 [Candidatus Melainabacteria bacterium]|nr:MAG: hypothetical protein DKT66_14030 [Candidatus Melainabacteria bacterium]